MLWILNSENLALKPSFCTMRAYLRDARCESFFALGAGDDDLAGRENEDRRLGAGCA
jgi:hypothetical protein